MTKPHQSISHIYNPDNQSKEELVNGFVVRLEVFKGIFKDIKAEKSVFPEQHFMIEGKRGMGKTSMLLRLKYEIQDDPDLNTWLIPILFNEEEYGILNLHQMWERTAELLEEYNEDMFGGLAALMDAQFSKYKSDAEFEKAIFELLITKLKENDKKIIIFIDNFGFYIDKFKRQEIQRFRTILQTSREIGIVGATAQTLEATHDYKHPFYEFFKTRRLRGLNKEETIKVLQQLGTMYNAQNVAYILEHHPERVESLRRLTGGVIRSVVLMFEIFTEDKKGTTFQNLEALLDTVTPLYKHRMDELPTQQQQIVQALALGWDALATKEIAAKTRLESKVVSAQLAQLAKNEVIEQIDTHTKNHLYRIDERFFNIWYLMRFGRKGDKNNVVWLIRFFEEWCSPDELTERAKKFINQIQSRNYDAKGALYMAQALSSTKHTSNYLRNNILEKTKEFYEAKGQNEYLRYLDKSDNELNKKGWELIRESKWTEAIKVFKKMHEPNFLAIGNCYAGLNDIDNAEKSYLEVSKRNKWRYGKTLTEEALAESTKKGSKDMDEFYDAVDKTEANAEAILKLLDIYKDRKDYEKIIQQYLALTHVTNSKESYIYIHIASYYFKLGKIKDADIYIEKALEDKNISGDSLCLLALLYDNEYKDYAKAESYYLKAIEAGNNNALNNLATLYTSEYKDYQKAKDIFESAIAKSNALTYNNYAWLLFEHFPTEKEKALIYAQKAVEKDSNIYQLHTLHTLACIQLWNNQHEAAFASANQFLYDAQSVEDFDDDYRTFLLLAIAKKQYQLVYEYFTGEQGVAMQTRNRFKPLWYALMHYMREEHPIEYLRMGSELKETVEEIIAKIDEMTIKYA
jgi:tetratricopeptide (TPR) repeat protein